MNIFLAFLIGCFFVGYLTWQKKERSRRVFVVLGALFLCAAYYFLNQL